MKVRLMFEDRDFDLKAELPYGRDDLITDLSLKRILKAMAQEDEVVLASCKQGLLSPLRSQAEIIYRQENLKDVLAHPEAIRQLYQITTKVLQKQHSSWYLMDSWLPSNATELLEIFIDGLVALRQFSEEWLDSFRSRGFSKLLEDFQAELNEGYITEIREILTYFGTKDDSWIAVNFGNYLQGQNYRLLKKEKLGFSLRLLRSPSYTLAARDEQGAKDIAQRKNRAKNEAQNALAQAAEHLATFFRLLREETAFYLGALNLAVTLQQTGNSYSFPQISKEKERYALGLYDCSLALKLNKMPITNNLPKNQAKLLIVTGANQGGKSTFLRSLGQAQLMTQAGLFVPAEELSFPICQGIFSHFKREEDKTMESGKLDEELARMDLLANHLEKGSLVLFNESFSASNERESSEISKQITQALIQSGVEVFSVTHLYSFAHSFINSDQTLFLRAERLTTGKRSFKILLGEPEKTAFGLDLYQKIFSEN